MLNVLLGARVLAQHNDVCWSAQYGALGCGAPHGAVSWNAQFSSYSGSQPGEGGETY